MMSSSPPHNGNFSFNENNQADNNFNFDFGSSPANLDDVNLQFTNNDTTTLHPTNHHYYQSDTTLNNIAPNQSNYVATDASTLRNVSDTSLNFDNHGNNLNNINTVNNEMISQQLLYSKLANTNEFTNQHQHHSHQEIDFVPASNNSINPNLQYPSSHSFADLQSMSQLSPSSTVTSLNSMTILNSTSLNSIASNLQRTPNQPSRGTLISSNNNLNSPIRVNVSTPRYSHRRSKSRIEKTPNPTTSSHNNLNLFISPKVNRNSHRKTISISQSNQLTSNPLTSGQISHLNDDLRIRAQNGLIDSNTPHDSILNIPASGSNVFLNEDRIDEFLDGINSNIDDTPSNNNNNNDNENEEDDADGNNDNDTYTFDNDILQSSTDLNRIVGNDSSSFTTTNFSNISSLNQIEQIFTSSNDLNPFSNSIFDTNREPTLLNPYYKSSSQTTIPPAPSSSSSSQENSNSQFIRGIRQQSSHNQDQIHDVINPSNVFSNPPTRLGSAGVSRISRSKSSLNLSEVASTRESNLSLNQFDNSFNTSYYRVNSTEDSDLNSSSQYPKNSSNSANNLLTVNSNDSNSQISTLDEIAARNSKSVPSKHSSMGDLNESIRITPFPRVVSKTNIEGTSTDNNKKKKNEKNNNSGNSSIPEPLSSSSSSVPNRTRSNSKKSTINISTQTFDKPERSTRSKSRSSTKNSDKTNVCLLCGSKFGRPEHVKRHMISHSSEKPFECTICHRKFNRRDNLNQHMRNIHKDHNK